MREILKKRYFEIWDKMFELIAEHDWQKEPQCKIQYYELKYQTEQILKRLRKGA